MIISTAPPVALTRFYWPGSNRITIMTASTRNIAFTILSFCLSACEQQPSHELNSKLDDLKSKVDLISIQTTQMQGSLNALTPIKYGVTDTEHKKFVGFLTGSPAPQVGTAIVWDDDVYLVELIRLHTQKKYERKIGGSDTTVERPVDVEVMVKFLNKVNSAEDKK